MMDYTKLAQVVMRNVREFVQPAIDSLIERIDDTDRAIRLDVDQKFADLPKPERGEKGERGEIGPAGESIKGDPGEKGERGESGPRGERGEKGERGESGPAGERGEIGPKGDSGEKGERGAPGPAGESIKGDPGQDGKSVSVEDVLPILQAELRRAIEAIPAPLKGDRGEPGPPGPPGESVKGDRGEDGKSVTTEDVMPVLKAELDAAIKAIAIPKDGLAGKDGRDGIDGKSVTVDQVLPALTAQVQKFIDALPIPQDGKDGLNGKDGKSITVEDVRGLFEAEQAKWALEFERRAQDLIQRCIDRIPIPKDGKDGKDGRNALEIENFDCSLGEDGRTLTLSLARGEDRIERQIRLAHVLYRGIYKATERYCRGDSVTFGGSTWIAMRDTDSKPETDDSWKLSVKRGRDGRDGAIGPRGPEGPKARA